MSPAELKRRNIEHFQRMLNRTANLRARTEIEGLIVDERAGADSEYPAPGPRGASR